MPSHSETISAISRDREREQRHRRAEGDELGRWRRGPTSAKASRSTSSSCALNGMSTMFRPRMPAGPSYAVGAVAADGLRDRHHRVARLGERGVDGHVADHARDEPVLGVVALEQPLEQLHAQRLDLVDVLRAREPAVHRADVTLGGALADLGGEQLPDRRADERLGREQVHALVPAPRSRCGRPRPGPRAASPRDRRPRRAARGPRRASPRRGCRAGRWRSFEAPVDQGSQREPVLLDEVGDVLRAPP